MFTKCIVAQTYGDFDVGNETLDRDVPEALGHADLTCGSKFCVGPISLGNASEYSVL
jgi:hypothetical protein